METTENNKLIAEFMGATQLEKGIVNFKGIFLKEGKSFFNDYDLKFHSDWNWLMKVVEKIYSTVESITEEQNSEWDILTRNIRDTFYFPKIESVYNACFEFIKWYNNQQE